MRHVEAARAAIEGSHYEPYIGTILADHVQIVPQSFGIFDEATAETLMRRYPATRFRLHANVRVLREMAVYDLSNFDQHPEHWQQAAKMSRYIGASAYSAHAGGRKGTLNDVCIAARRASELLGCPVAVEGHYPERGNADKYHVSTWEEYRRLFESGVPYALDLSHLNIVAHYSNRTETTLVAEMLACERCIEVHLSDNDGRGDQHQTLTKEPWWLPLLPYINPSSVVFTEGNHRRAAAKETQ